MRALMLRFMRLGWSQQQLVAALPGFTTCVVIALAAGYAAVQTGAPPMLCALLVGTAAVGTTLLCGVRQALACRLAGRGGGRRGLHVPPQARRG